MLDLDKVNRDLRHASPEKIIKWAIGQRKRIIATTSFGKNAAALLNIISTLDPKMITVWVDTGYNLRDTYIVANKLMKDIPLDYRVYSPLITSERRNAIMGGIPSIDDEAQHADFTRQVKLEPFNRAINELSPEIWITGLRREETEHRKSLDIVSIDDRGIIKVSPLFYWSDGEVDQYMQENNLYSCKHYFDPTKVFAGRECGLHTTV